MTFIMTTVSETDREETTMREDGNLTNLEVFFILMALLGIWDVLCKLYEVLSWLLGV